MLTYRMPASGGRGGVICGIAAIEYDVGCGRRSSEVHETLGPFMAPSAGRLDVR